MRWSAGPLCLAGRLPLLSRRNLLFVREAVACRERAGELVDRHTFRGRLLLICVVRVHEWVGPAAVNTSACKGKGSSAVMMI